MTMPETPPPPNLEDLQADLKSLGAETESQRRAKHILPWIGSVTAHLLLILLGFLIPWTTQFFLSEEEQEPVAIVADLHNLTPGLLAVNDMQTTSAETTDSALQTDAQEITIPTDVPNPLEDLTSDLDLSGPASESDALQGFAPSGEGDSVSFGGLRGSNAKNIVYLVDASGSMMPYLSIVIDELTRSIDQLTDTQNFAVIFFQKNEAVLVPGPDDQLDAQGQRRRGRGRTKLLPGSAANKLFVYSWIDLDAGHIRATGTSNPIEALELALDGMQPNPDVVFVLSTDITGLGEYEVDQSELLKLISRLNRDRTNRLRTVIKTIQFIEEDPLESLKKIAEQNGGLGGYRFLSRADLGMN